MKTTALKYTFSIATLSLLAACGAKVELPEDLAAADTIYQGKIYTGADEIPLAELVAVKDGYITAVYAEAPELPEGDERLVNFGEATAYPGFTDAHSHLESIGYREMVLNLEGTTSLADLKKRVAGEASRTPAGEVVFGRGWIETGWPEGRFPNRFDLDEVTSDHPVILVRTDGHAVVVNSMALEMAGITDETPDPAGGAIERDENGAATGMLIDNAESLVTRLMASPSRERRLEGLQRGAAVYAQYGWTGTHSMSADPFDVELMVELEETGKMPIRVYNAVTPGGLDGLIETGIWDLNDGKVTTRAVKLYIDGALGSRGAALKAPYSDKPNSRGLLLMTEEVAKDAFKKALDNGIQVTTHAIGDRGNLLVLDWYEDILKDHEGESPRWRIEHAQIIDPVDIPRFKELGIIASMQPSHAIGDLHFAPARLGDERLYGAYAWRSLTDAGALIAGGSDAPVERGDPMIEFYAAVGRMDLKGFQGANWHPEEALTREEALDIFTINPAIASFNENRLGTLEVNKKADLTVLSKDIMVIPVEEIPGVKAVLTIVDGKIVYDGR